MLRRSLALASVVATLALPAGAQAHNLSQSYAYVDVNTPVKFFGTFWQPSRRVTVEYFVTPNAAAPFRTLSVGASGRGSFVFTWFDRLIGRDFGLTHKMCFRQFDTRFGRTFRKCARFYVTAPYAQWMPATGNPGDTFVLFAAGFLPGRVLTVTTTPPPGISPGGPFTVVTATRGSFVTNVPCASAGPSFLPVYVPRGGAACGFVGGNAGPGLYVSLVRDPVSGMQAYATARLLR